MEIINKYSMAIFKIMFVKGKESNLCPIYFAKHSYRGFRKYIKIGLIRFDFVNFVDFKITYFEKMNHKVKFESRFLKF